MSRINQRFQTLISASIVNASLNAALVIVKIVIGYLGNSQALIADGIHSLSDLITDFLVFIGGYMGKQLPDKEHPYGHQRIETITAIIISIVLIVVAMSIAYDTIHHMVHPIHLKKPYWPVLLVAFFSVLSNEFLFRYTRNKGKEINSDLLKTNAWHNRSDALVSLIVLISIIGTLLGVLYLDMIAALFIAALILKVGFQLIWGSIKELIDTAVPKDMIDGMYQAILSVPGVVSIHQMRTRAHGGNILIDLHIQVNPFISVSEGHYIGDQVQNMLLQCFTSIIDITIHVDPENDEKDTLSWHLSDRTQVKETLEKYCSTLSGFEKIKSITIHYVHAQLYVTLDLPIDIIHDPTDIKKIEQAYRDAIKASSIIHHLNITISS